MNNGNNSPQVAYSDRNSKPQFGGQTVDDAGRYKMMVAGGDFQTVKHQNVQIQ